MLNKQVTCRENMRVGSEIVMFYTEKVQVLKREYHLGQNYDDLCFQDCLLLITSKYIYMILLVTDTIVLVMNHLSELASI